jgi:predicted nucleic acid-binding protein
MAGAVSLQPGQASAALRLPLKHRLILADASPLIGLSLVDQLPLLPALFGTVQVAPIVLQEVLTGQFDHGESAIRAAMDAGWLVICSAQPANIVLTGLDPGETQSILQAYTLAQLGLSPVLLMDEKAGRAAATELGLPCLGTAAIIATAKQLGLIPSAAQVLEQLFQTDFRISQSIIRAVLASVGETL